METKRRFFSFKDRRSKSCLHRSSTRYGESNRTSSLTDHSQLDSSTESIQRHSTPKHQLYKLRKESYQNAKRRILSQVDQILKDSSIVIRSDWLKVRGTFRDWTKLWAILKPGLILFYRNPISLNGVWVGTVVLSSCQVMQRPSKKSGFCFKIWHPLEKSIWSQRGPNNEQFGGFTFPLPMNYLICRAIDETAGRCWMDALELTMKCSKLLQQPHSSKNDNTNVSDNEVDLIKPSRSETTDSGSSEERITDLGTAYILASPEEMGELGNAGQTEEIAEEKKSLLMYLLKQVRPGMDLSKVVLPTFILEPRSLLEKFSDYYYHCDILEEAVNSSDPLVRMQTIVKFYLSGFYKKPKGLKKPYNPVLGEVHRCYFHHPNKNSKTFYIAEQISHHPPITNFYVTNRQEGFCVQGSILTRSKFYGNSLSAILDGTARISLLNTGEDYLLTMPYANCKGILIGRLTMELGGKVTIICEKTHYSVDIEFKLKPFLGSQELINLIEGKICLEKELICTFYGRWDDEIILVDKATNMKSTFWKVTPTVINSRLKRYVVPIEQQQDHESEKLWQHVTSAIRQNDQILATEGKTTIENEQRKRIRDSQMTGIVWQPRLFRIDSKTKQWMYIHADSRPWDVHNDISTYEKDFIIHTQTHPHSQELLQPHSNHDENIIAILRRIEQNLNHTNEQIDLYEKRIQNYQRNFLVSFLHFILIVSVAITLKYIFQ